MMFLLLIFLSQQRMAQHFSDRKADSLESSSQPLQASYLHVSEEHLRRRVEHCFYEGAQFVGVQGERVQVIAKGEWHQTSAPDIAQCALLVNGKLHVGNAEFHRRTSEWFAHGHQNNPAYAQLVAHIVCEHDNEKETGAVTTICITEEMMCSAEERVRAMPSEQDTPSSTALMVAQYAVARLERKADDIFRSTRTKAQTTPEIVRAGLEHFLLRLQAKKTRKNGITSAVQSIIHDAKAITLVAHIMDELLHEEAMLWRIQTLLETYISHGATMEIMTNVVAPLLLAHLPVYGQDRVWAWWWSAEAGNPYRILSARFPTVRQRYVWQQQGLLEMLAQPRGVAERVAEKKSRYGNNVSAENI